MCLTATHLFSLFLTIMAVLSLGIYSACRVKSAEGFSLGGRTAGAAIVSGAIAGTVIGGAATIGTAQLAYSIGLTAWWFTLGCGIGFIIMGLFYARPLRDTGLETISQYLALNFGKTVAPLTSIISSLGIFLSIVASSLAGIHLISALFGLASWQAATVIVLLVFGYVLLGGMKGAGLSGIIKVVVIYATLFFAGGSAFLALYKMPNLGTTFPAYPWFSLMGNGVWSGLGDLFSLIVGIICTQTYAQAIYSARDSHTAVIGSFTAALVTIPVGLPSVAIGLFMHVNHPEILPINALPLYMINYMPAWLGGIGIAGLLLSVVGSIAGLVLGIGTMVSRDIFHGLLGIMDGKKLLWINRATIFLVALCAMSTALLKLQSLVLNWNFLSMALRGAGVFLPLTLAIFLPGKLTPGWATASMIVSTLAAVTCKPLLSFNLDPLFVGIAVSALIVGMGMVFRQNSRCQSDYSGQEIEKI